MRRLCSYKLKSHENTYLIDHLRFVGDRAEKLIITKDLHFSYSKDMLEKIARVMGYCHDLGKGTSYFQQYLEDMIKYKESKVDDILKSHGGISALICYHNLRNINKELALVSYLTIKRHHGNLRDFREECNLTALEIKAEKELINKQLNALDKEVINICSELSLKIMEVDELSELIDDLYEMMNEYNEELENNEDAEKYILFKYLFSLLIYSDKEHAIFKSNNDIIYDLPSNLIDEYKIKKFGLSKPDNIRNIVYDDIMKNIKSSNNRIMSITLPTGTGKTLASMSAALKLKERLNKDMKIIYCLPFTSVIDQNFEEYKTAINEVNDGKATSEQILKHHYLSSKDYKKSDLYYEGDEGRFLTQSWNSQIVVTTFIQFFNTIFSNGNSDLIKYNTLANSIVLLDEVQSIPYKYWEIINGLFMNMAERLNMYFMFVTATQPLIFDENEIFELAKGSKEYFKQFKRTKLIVKDKSMEKEVFFEFVKGIVSSNREKNILIIVNTIKLSQEIFKQLKEMDDTREKIYLSTSIVPKTRKERIDKIKELGNRKIVVSTQMVEAGVDIDMDIVIRDIAPLDSINQSAGRANRENRGEYLGEVYITRVEQNGKDLARYVYKDDILLQATQKVLKGKSIILEVDYKELSDSYFKELKNNSSKNKSRNLEKMICYLDFENINKNFQLIEDQYKVSVFIEVDKDAQVVWKKYEEYKQIKDIFQRRNKLESIKGEFYQYIISVFKNRYNENIDSDIAYISINQLNNTYDENFGYKVKEDKLVIL
ncbi:MAG: CRISPR-associated helicase Cas3' [Clostridium sp.]|uniref:CRISPR-associated helicase Cas3' n=1 Tax=Clostridium sp. TaxID=1506 RepID=UPI003036DC39